MCFLFILLLVEHRGVFGPARVPNGTMQLLSVLLIDPFEDFLFNLINVFFQGVTWLAASVKSGSLRLSISLL